MEKRCPKCESVKPATEFHKCKNYKDGLASWCKVCCKAQKLALYRADPEKERARVSAWYGATGAQMRQERKEARNALLPSKDPTIKRCPRCEQTLPLAAFSKGGPKRFDGLSGYCKKCQSKSAAKKRREMGTRPVIDIPEVKFCSDCKAAKPASLFYKNKASKDGLELYCKECSSRRSREWAKRMPPTSRLKVRGHCAKRNALKKGAQIGKVDFYEIALRDNFTCYLCGLYLEIGIQMHFDHVIPLSKGGAHSNDNLRVACATCNMKKGAKILI